MHTGKPGWSRQWNRAFAALFVLLASCLFETKEPDPEQPGYLNLELTLRSNSSALFKSASADTVFRLDSVIIILSATGAATLTNTYAVSGRSDSGNIVVSQKVFALAPLRTWKAKILSIDTTLNPARRDTVHIDSVSFTINPGDTANVSKTVNPVFSILRARLVSNRPDSLANTVKYLRIRVDGITRDSTLVGPNLRSVAFGNSNTGCAVGDSGTILRLTNSGSTWTPATGVTTRNLYSVSFPGTNVGWAAGEAGTVATTTNGTAWSVIAVGTSQNLKGTSFTSNSNGWFVGDAGTIIKTGNGTTFTAQTSGTTRNLNAVHFFNTNNGNAVGDNGTILRSANGGTLWSAQTSGTTQNLNAIFLTSANTGFAVGNGGTILRTLNGGTNWSALPSGTTANLNGVHFTTATAGYIVGDGGMILSTSDSTTWTKRTSGTVQNLNGVGWTTNDGTAAAVGTLGTMLTSINGTAYTIRLIGAKSFDVYLTYKYFTPNVSHTLLMNAVDTLSGTLRGYQASKVIVVAPGRDTTVTPNSGLVKCGYGAPTAACTP